MLKNNKFQKSGIMRVSQNFASGFFHESVSPQPQSIPLGPFRIFSKIRGDTGGKFATGVNDTGGKIAAGNNHTAGKFCHQFG
jgi:hypothetical protein